MYSTVAPFETIAPHMTPTTSIAAAINKFDISSIPSHEDICAGFCGN
jgi:hypothetical protein